VRARPAARPAHAVRATSARRARGGRARAAARLALAVALGLVTAIAVAASPAWAHVEVSADKTEAGATNVTVTFHGEAESTAAGIASEQVFLPGGITANQVHLAKAPAGWAFTTGPDSFTVAGTALPKGTDAQWSVVIDKLPANVSQLVFKTIETYGDGEIVRWITEQQPGQPEPEHPAPVLKLTGSAVASSSAVASASATAASTAPAAGGGSSGWWTLAAVAVIILLVGVIALVARRRRTPPAPPPAG
jgi:hypothetical protein